MPTTMSETVPIDGQNQLGGRSEDEELNTDFGQLRVKCVEGQQKSNTQFLLLRLNSHNFFLMFLFHLGNHCRPPKAQFINSTNDVKLPEPAKIRVPLTLSDAEYRASGPVCWSVEDTALQFEVEKYVTRSLDQNIVDQDPEMIYTKRKRHQLDIRTLTMNKFLIRRVCGRRKCLDTMENENSIGRLGRWTDILESLGSVQVEINVHIVLFPQLKKKDKNYHEDEYLHDIQTNYDHH
ncbi:unnamed protein product [Pocillopora meandrina]|uniref:Uncharacterized protein n=1 Tax=Pocillopora meandrina TaxID=46732 RepID=A0AAU9XL33_9CNID|nr:unnamed protein product [Pocillopora meandrina]